MMQPLVSSLSSRDDITRERRNVSNENTTKTLFLVPSGARQPGVTTASLGYGVKNTLERPDIWCNHHTDLFLQGEVAVSPSYM